MTLDEVKRQLFADSDDVIGNDMVDLYEAQNCCDTSFNIGYNKAVDDFSEKIKEFIDDNGEKFNCYPFKCVDEIAEQLKGGDVE